MEATAPRTRPCVLAVVGLGLLVGCTHWTELSPQQVIDKEVWDRVAAASELKSEPTEPASANPDTADGRAQVIFTLPEAIAFALKNSPRLFAAQAEVERARGQADVAFAPFLPDLQLNTRYVQTSANLSPGAPGITGGVIGSGEGTRRFGQAELQLQWALCDFGRTAGRFGRASMHQRMADLRSQRAAQTVAFDVANAYLQVLLAAASRVVQEDAIRAAEATLKDSRARRAAGTADRDDVLRAEVHLSEVREGLVIAREEEQADAARLNMVLGRNASLPIRVIDWKDQPLFVLTLPQCLETAAAQRLEIGVVRDGIAAAQEGRKAVEGEFMPSIYALATVGYVDGEHVQDGWQEGFGIHLNQAVYRGGRFQGELRSAEADVSLAVARAQGVLDGISLEVTLAYRSATSARERISLSQPAIEQARENLRLVRVKYRNGDATPTDIVDAESTLTRSQQRFAAAVYEYLTALARMEYALGGSAGTCLRPPAPEKPEMLPPPKPEP